MILPILRDGGDLRGRFGTVVMAAGSAGEFGPIIATALLLVAMLALSHAFGLGRCWARSPRAC